MTYEELDEFKKDLKHLLKKYRTLNEDMTDLKKALAVAPDAEPPFSFRISDLQTSTCVIKVKKIACRALKGNGVNSGLRLIYAYFIKEERIVMIELYHKNDKENENKERIKKYFK